MKTYSSQKHLPLLLVVVLTLQLYGCGSCFHKQRRGLLEIKAFFNSFVTTEENIRENILPSWTDDPNSNCCHWERVKCSRATGHVVELLLDQMMPPTSLSPNRILNLSLFHSFEGLQSLNFSYNWFNGLFDHIVGVKSFARLKEFMILDFSHNYFNNSILPFLSAATSLRTLDLGYNYHIGGVFPPKELTSMANLRLLKASNNSFSFLSSQDLTNLRELEMLDLSMNDLTNSDAGQGFSFLTKLQTLDLSHNSFTDFAQLQGLAHLKELRVLNLGLNRFNNTTLHRQVFDNLTKLKVLDLCYNMLSGNHLFKDLRNLRHLEVLKLGGNKIEGFLTNQAFVNWIKLKVLDLSNNLFAGKPEVQGICEFAHLQELDLSNNAIIGLPNCLGNLTYLQTLDLSNNQLNGSLAFLMPKLSSLEYLSLLNNNFDGSFLFSSLTNQSRLKVFRLSSNLGMIQVQTKSSWIPPFQLKVLQLRNSTSGGEIPNFLLHQHDLRIIDLSYNKMVGVFPSWLLKNNTKLNSISLRNNSLTKFQLPTLIHGLSNLDISNNKIVGSIHESIGKIFPNLSALNISNNGFHGVIPSSMGEIKGLQTLDMSSNSLSGQLPRKFLYNCSSLWFLKLSNNKFQGRIFPEYSNLTNLRYLFLDRNNFTGIDKGLSKSNLLVCLDISNNMLSGTIPSWIGRFSLLRHIWMTKNQIEGTLPHQLEDLHVLNSLDISNNKLSGPIPRNVKFSSLQELSLQNNDLVGSIPDAFFQFSKLQLLDLRNNNLVGKIPSSIGKLSRIKVLLLQKNHLQGHIPNEICQLRKVNILDLSHNRLSGFTPSCLSNISFGLSQDWVTEESFATTSITTLTKYLEINIFYKSAFDLSGGEVSYLLDSHVIVDFLTKQRYEHFQGVILQNMFGLDLSCNELSGEIPFRIGDLQIIRSLNLSHNRLTGSIPESISKLENIENLDLSYNRLNGCIPAQLAELDSLAFFNVSYNNLGGPIPFTGHLITYDESCYIGNANLCGKPTNKSCNPSKVPNKATTQLVKEEEDDSALVDTMWFYWTLGATYVTILLGLFVFLCIDTRWSQAWFYHVDLCIYYLQRLKRAAIFK